MGRHGYTFGSIHVDTSARLTTEEQAAMPELLGRMMLDLAAGIQPAMSKDSPYVRRMPLAFAQRAGLHVLKLLAPYCDRIQVAGSVRRLRPEVGDLEVVCIPALIPVRDMFGPVAGAFQRRPGFIEQLDAWEAWLTPEQKVVYGSRQSLERLGVELLRLGKGTPRLPAPDAPESRKYEGRYMQRILGIKPGRPGIKLDLFTCTAETWGNTYAVRTGSAAFSHQVLAGGWVQVGCHSDHNVLTRYGQPVVLLEEQDLFDLIGLAYVEPPLREVVAGRRFVKVEHGQRTIPERPYLKPS